MVEATPEPPFEDPCVVYKPLTTDGGLERYVSELARVLDAPVYVERQTTHPEHFADVDVRAFGDRSRTDRLLARVGAGAVVETLAYENFAVPERYDAVVTVGESAKAALHRPEQRRFHVLNMAPRWLFDRGPGRFDGAIGPVRLAARAYQSLFRVHDVATTARIDDVVVPSETVGRRLETYYDRTPSEVVYPPVDVDDFRHEPSEGYLLYLGRLAPAKGVRELVADLSGTEHELRVAGTGPLEDELRRLAGPNVEVLGRVTEAEKRSLLARCEALVFNSDDEAFGIVPIEALASGKPVVAVDDGYTRFQVEHGVNGVRFERGDLLGGVAECVERDWDPAEIAASARRYGRDRFAEEWRRLVLEGD